MNTHITGTEGEDRACEFLKQQGYEILHRNWRTRYGEIDIIAYKTCTLVFAEVKTLPHGNISTLEYVLGTVKRKRIIETAKYFLCKYRKYNDSYIRFDVLVIDLPGFAPVCHIENAFSE